MASSNPPLLYAFLVSLLLLSPLAFTSEPLPERTLVVAPSVVMQLSRGLAVIDSPGKPGKTVFCERVHIYGLSRLRNLSKFAHSVTVQILGRNSGAYLPNAEVCFHRNKSLAIGMCSEDQWEKIVKGSWVRHMSPFDQKLLDIRSASSSLESYDVTISEEFSLHRVIFLALGILMLSVASFLSKSLVFYYGSAMAIGIILVILVVLFQGMKLMPFGGRKLAFLFPTSIAGFAFLLKQVAPGFLRSLLVMIGLDEEMYDPVVKFLMAFVVLAGAWMGFWVVRKLILIEDGSIDLSTCQLVVWTIRIMGALLIIQSSTDPILATEALLFGIVISSILRKIFRLRFLRCVYRKLSKSSKKDRRVSSYYEDDSSASEESFDTFANGIPSNEETYFLRRPTKNFQAASKSPDQGLSRRTPIQQRDNGIYLSSFHVTPERRKFSKQGWEKFTNDSTERALEELASSPGFGKWLHQNAGRISITPNTAKAERRRSWLLWS